LIVILLSVAGGLACFVKAEVKKRDAERELKEHDAKIKLLAAEKASKPAEKK